MQYFCNQSRSSMFKVERAFLYCQIISSYSSQRLLTKRPAFNRIKYKYWKNGIWCLFYLLDSFKIIFSVLLSINKLQNAYSVPRSYCRLSKVKKWSLFYMETFRVSPPISRFYRDYSCIFAFNKRKKIFVFKVAEKKKETLEDLFITDDSHVWYCLLELF